MKLASPVFILSSWSLIILSSAIILLLCPLSRPPTVLASFPNAGFSAGSPVFTLLTPFSCLWSFLFMLPCLLNYYLGCFSLITVFYNILAFLTHPNAVDFFAYSWLDLNLLLNVLFFINLLYGIVNFSGCYIFCICLSGMRIYLEYISEYFQYFLWDFYLILCSNLLMASAMRIINKLKCMFVPSPLLWASLAQSDRQSWLFVTAALRVYL